MAIVIRYDGALLPYQSVRLTGSGPGGISGLPSSASYGEPMTAGITIEDPNGTLDFDGWHTFTVEESACSKPRIFSGWVTGKSVSRGPYVNGAGRVWDCDIIDINALFSLEVFRASSAKRPAETDIVRAAWAIASGPMSGTPIFNNGRANFTDNPIPFGDANYVTNYPVELFTSIAATAGKNFYAYYDDAAHQVSLHYDLVGVGPASTLRLSNVSTDYDGVTTFAPAIDAVLTRSPENVYTGVLFGYRGGYVYARKQTTINSLSPSEFSPTNFLRDVVYRTDRVGHQGTAEILLQDQLTAHATEQDTITCMVQLPASKVNLIKEGDVVSVKFSHLPGYSGFVSVAVIRRNVVPTADLDDYYDVHLELTNGATERGPGGGSPGVFPALPCAVTLANSDEHDDTANNLVALGMDVANTPTPGNIQVAWVLTRDIATKTTPTGFTAVGSWQADPASGGGHKAMGCRFFYRTVAVGDTKHIAFTTGGGDRIYVSVTEWAGPDTFDGLSTWTNDEDVSTDPDIYASASVTPQADRANVFICAIMPSLNVNDNWFPTALNRTAIDIAKPGYGGGTSAVAKGWVGYQTPPKRAVPLLTYLQMSNSPSSGIRRGYAALTLAFSGPCADNPPDAAQPIGAEQPPSVGGGQTTFTTNTPYAEGSLKVYVDGIRQPATETNPAAGTYQLLFDPRPSEYVVVDYQARPG